MRLRSLFLLIGLFSLSKVEASTSDLSAATLPVLNLVITGALIGLIWIVQLVHYPSFHFIAEIDFSAFHGHHTRSITWIVLPLMLGELALGFYLAAQANWAMSYLWPFVMVVLLWLSTFLVQVPLHNALGAGKDPALIDRLVQTNWWRTALWTIKGLWLTWVLLKAPQ